MVIDNPPPLTAGVCGTCQGSGYDPVEFHEPDPALGRLITPCLACDGTGEQPPEEEG